MVPCNSKIIVAIIIEGGSSYTTFHTIKKRLTQPVCETTYIATTVRCENDPSSVALRRVTCSSLFVSQYTVGIYIARGNHFLDSSGKLHTPPVHNPWSQSSSKNTSNKYGVMSGRKQGPPGFCN